MKTCSKCKISKSLSEFGGRTSSLDNLHYICKICKTNENAETIRKVQEKKDGIKAITNSQQRSQLNLCGSLRPVLNKLGYTSTQVNLIAQEAYDKTGVDLVDEKCPYYDVCGVECVGRPFPKLQESTYHQIRKILPNMVTTEYRGSKNYVAKQLQCDSCAIKSSCSKLCPAMTGYMLKNDCEQSRDGDDIFDSNTTHAFTLGYVGEHEFQGASDKFRVDEYLEASKKNIVTTSPYCDGVKLGDSQKGMRSDVGGSIYNAIDTTEERNMLVSREDIQWHVLEPIEADILYLRNIKQLYKESILEELELTNVNYNNLRKITLKKIREAHEDSKSLKRHEMLNLSVRLGHQKGLSVQKMAKSLKVSKFVVERYLDFYDLNE